MAFIQRIPGMITPYRWVYDTRQTTDGSLQTMRIGTLAAIGAGITVAMTFFGIQTNGQNGYRFQFWADSSRNSVGSNGAVTGTIGAGYTDVAAAPWNTSATPPAGWAVPAIVVTGNDVDVTWAGAAGQTVNWSVIGELLYVGTVTDPP